ncbi:MULTISPECIES: cell division protein ZapA [Halomonadaceae]|uniref:Cell division protein ZapA n=1 Tax=Vreelandella hamiltonii TaxID=502829 RepID=A0A8H9I3D7_9GAMM|nr:MULTISPECIES: cell division protein ZapA [Halomonas]ATH77032.1 cell division protein ZapA [Halomonas hydrothermalis]KHJ51394.1 cell division protein ZapA [Halomonas hydrothermalis]MDM7482374.1 cell division protein ZapA [Halomonas sp.]UDM07375.1 cell division protein ZapA [Halomonas sp. NyZ770]GGW28723.1 cell division protein ZapA [Halomonas hamiltonii]
MSTAKRPTKEITLLGRSYVIACDSGQEVQLERAARYLDRAMHGIHAQSSVLGNERIAIMAALNITHELLEALDEHRAGEANLSRLNERLERALAGTRKPTDA